MHRRVLWVVYIAFRGETQSRPGLRRPVVPTHSSSPSSLLPPFASSLLSTSRYQGLRLPTNNKRPSEPPPAPGLCRAHTQTHDHHPPSLPARLHPCLPPTRPSLPTRPRCVGSRRRRMAPPSSRQSAPVGSLPPSPSPSLKSQVQIHEGSSPLSSAALPSPPLSSSSQAIIIIVSSSAPSCCRVQQLPTPYGSALAGRGTQGQRTLPPASHPPLPPSLGEPADLYYF